MDYVTLDCCGILFPGKLYTSSHIPHLCAPSLRENFKKDHTVKNLPKSASQACQSMEGGGSGGGSPVWVVFEVFDGMRLPNCSLIAKRSCRTSNPSTMSLTGCAAPRIIQKQQKYSILDIFALASVFLFTYFASFDQKYTFQFVLVSSLSHFQMRTSLAPTHVSPSVRNLRTVSP